MNRIQSVLAATDFSPDARHAAERAAVLGATTAIPKGVLLHVVEKSWLDTLKHFLSAPEEVEQKIIDDASRALAQLVKEAQQLSGFALEPQVLSGNTLDTLVEAASNFDLLVLGARGRHPVRALALGTTSQRLLSKVRRPVLVVKRKAEKPYQGVLVATDFSSNSLKGLQYARVVAPQALIHVVHVFEPLFERKMIAAGVSDEVLEKYRVEAQLEAETEMTRFIDESGENPRKLVRIIEHGNAPGKLPEIVAKWAPDLVVVGKHGRWRIEEFLLGSVTLHVLAQSRCDVLVAE
ncbi:universal stress protein [Syntrophorhabdus aromaticivorans]|uniref:universal stress protein n=1 Tax=Syntrophorhabdus aromaticivorans TaxID=328301 RepID=UPI00042403E7|nr:universal stress protein [Syntrophorhabdus aromaticivorans]